MALSIIRCDDRLIHGQCVVKVLNDFKVKRILLVDDFTANNPVIKSIYKAAAPPNVKISILNVKDSISKIKEAVDNTTSTLLLIKDPSVLVQIMQEVPGVNKELNIGPMSNRNGTIKAAYFANLLKKEIESIEELTNIGVRVYFQQVVEEKPVEWVNVRNEILSKI
ncbi:MAG: PTS sugar transporter subunit IIB [Clostridium sp.]|uniref:PTS system mannose/fructose/N-acetylgalactosamine-transporter subunit IIB n=1 Tax=Clostridium sp. TaxID=1506 RepID=UPI002912E86C|nr:PTS sugar transporter subunit IIB [Clostridium sp.]MDU5110804.1 PTS sugar transporter subunit IIB [Clostridium sp.]